MAKSRNRRRPPRSSKSGRWTPPDQPYRSVTSQMTPAYERAVREGADAELRGDAAEALRLHRSVPMFRQSTHGDRLHQLAELGGSAPGWMVNRWLTIQARRRIWTGGDETGTNRALQLVVPLIYPDGIQIERIGCTYVEQVMPYIYELDWVVRQADVYDLGALRQLVLDHASPELLDRTEHIWDWCDAPMRACRVEYVDPRREAPLRVSDLTSGEELQLLDLGAEVEAGQHVLGRIVPTSTSPGAMFDWCPLPIGGDVARAVAADPRRWLTTLHTAAVGRQLEPSYSQLPEASLTSELPYRAWMRLIDREPSDRGPDPAGLIDEAVRAALAIAQSGGAEIARVRHEISDLVLDPLFDSSIRWRFVSPEQLSIWRTLAESLAEPAKSRCEDLAMWCSAAPELPDAIA